MSDRARILAHADDQPAEWLRDLARHGQSVELIERIRSAAAALDECVEASNRKCSGVFVLKGTRFPLAQLFAELADGKNIRSIAKGFGLNQDQMNTLLHALAVCLDVPAANNE